MRDSRIGGIPVFSGVAKLFPKAKKPVVECTYAHYVSEDNGDVNIYAAFLADNRGSVPLAISRSRCVSGYNIELENGRRLQDVLPADTAEFRPIEVAPGKMEQFEARYAIPAGRMETIARRWASLNDRQVLSPLVLEMVLERRALTFVISNTLESGRMSPNKSLSRWDAPLAIKFELECNGSLVTLHERVPRKEGSNKHLE